MPVELPHVTAPSVGAGGVPRSTVAPLSDRPLLGISFMLVAYFCFSLIDTSVKWLAIAGFPAMQLAFMRYFAHFVIATGLLARDGLDRDTFRAPQIGWVVFRGSLIMASTVCNFFAVKYLSLTLTSTILFAAPLIVCALSWPLLGERVGPVRWAAIMLGFVGIVIAIRPFDDSFHWAVFLSLAAASCFALYSILTRKLAGKVSTNTMQFYSGAVGFTTLLPFAVAQWVWPESWLHWVLLVALGVWAWAGHQLLTAAHRFAPASTLTPYAYCFIVYLAVWSWLLFDDLPDQWTILGAAIIVTAGIIIWFRERQKAAIRQVV
ncbi:integral membrane protein [Ahrensia sp. R2A130]|nr:integral membrane protein [Ahrensia sp. R2A130]